MLVVVLLPWMCENLGLIPTTTNYEIWDFHTVDVSMGLALELAQGISIKLN